MRNNAITRLRMGIDLGGTKIEAAVLDGSGEVLVRQRVATPQQDYLATLKAIQGLVIELESQLGETCAIGLGTPGAVSLKTGLMKNCNSTVLNGQALQRDIEALLGRSVRMANDANCFALSEAVDGAAAVGKMVFGVILGTGVGGGVVFDKRCLTGRNAIAGEWGHNTLPGTSEGRACYCGKTDCNEVHLSGPGLLKTAQQHIPSLSSVEALVELADQHNAIALDIFRGYQRQLSRSLAQVVNVLDPDIIVLGGGLSNIPYLYPGLEDLMAEAVFGCDYSTPIVKAAFGDASGVRGAAWLWPN